jgi:hypothetical protein
MAIRTILESFEATQTDSQVRRRFYDENILMDVCGCLIRVSHGPDLNNITRFHSPDIEAECASFAHYTVREFLEGTRVTEGLSFGFGISRDSVLLDSFETALIHAPDQRHSCLMTKMEMFSAGGNTQPCQPSLRYILYPLREHSSQAASSRTDVSSYYVPTTNMPTW